MVASGAGCAHETSGACGSRVPKWVRDTSSETKVVAVWWWLSAGRQVVAVRLWSAGGGCQVVVGSRRKEPRAAHVFCFFDGCFELPPSPCAPPDSLSTCEGKRHALSRARRQVVRGRGSASPEADSGGERGAAWEGAFVGRPSHAMRHPGDEVPRPRAGSSGQWWADLGALLLDRVDEARLEELHLGLRTHKATRHKRRVTRA